MLDSPDARTLLGEVQAALRAGIAPGFQQTVTANAIALAMREADLAADTEREERDRLVALGCAGRDLAALNQVLALGLRNGSIDAARADLRRHLIATTVAKMEVDQPSYPAFRAYRAEAGAKP